MSPSSHHSAAGSHFKRHSEIANPIGVDTEVVSKSGIGQDQFRLPRRILLGTQQLLFGRSVAAEFRRPIRCHAQIFLGEDGKPLLEEAAGRQKALSAMISPPDPSRITDEAIHLSLQVHNLPAMPVW